MVVVWRRDGEVRVVWSGVRVGVGERRERCDELRRMMRIIGYRKRRIHGFREKKEADEILIFGFIFKSFFLFSSL